MPPRTDTWNPVNAVAPLPPHDILEMSCEEAQEGATRSEIEELKAAKDNIVEKDLPPARAVKSFERAADAIKNGIRVFISYKHIHEEVAREFQKKIRAYGQNRLARDEYGQPHAFLAAQGVELGKDYRRKILEEIEKAHWFFLLLPDVQFDREWPTHEAGYFERGMTVSERLICIHHEDTPTAKTLQDYQSCESTSEGLKQLFTQLFFEKQAIPGMNQITYDDYMDNLQGDAQKLSDWFKDLRPPPWPDICGRVIDIEHKGSKKYEDMGELLSARIVDMKNLKEAFDRSDTFRGDFKDLVANVNDDYHGRQWIEGLRCALNDAVVGRSPRAIEVPFFGAKRGWAFRANLHCVWRQDGQIDRFQVVFTEEVGQRIANVPEELDALETALRWSHRSWWEIYGAYQGHLTKQDVEDIYRYTQRAEHESQARGVTDPSILLRSFKDPKDIKRLGDYFQEYSAKYHDPKVEKGKEEKKLDIAFRDGDPKRLRECLNELKPMSLWFLKAAARRFAELVDELEE
jgi:hypothetical protein